MAAQKGHTKVGGRKKGTPNKATAEIREHAQQYTIEALDGLALIARNSTSDAARVSAWNALLDRGHGRPIQGVSLDVDVAITAIERRIVDPLVIEGDCEDNTPVLPSQSNSRRYHGPNQRSPAVATRRTPARLTGR